MRRTWTTTVIGAAAAVLLVGCGGSSEPAALSPSAEWANGICAARNDLATSIGALDDSLTFDSSSGQSSLEQAQQQVTDRLNAVKEDADALVSAVAAVPADAPAGVQKAQEQLTAQVDDAKTSLTATGDAVVAATQASTPQAFATSLVAAGTAAAASANSVKVLAESVKEYASTTNTAVRDAFAQAPACQVTPTS